MSRKKGVSVTVQKTYSRRVKLPVPDLDAAFDYVRDYWEDLGLDDEGVEFSIFILTDDGREAYITEGVE